MVKIMLVCCGGMSTSLLVNKMNSSAKEQGIDVEVFAIGQAEVKDNLKNVDVILLGPQVRYMLNNIKSEADKNGIAVEVINSLDYGTMNGKAVLQQALELMK